MSEETTIQIETIFQIMQKREHDFIHTPVTIVDGDKFYQLEQIKNNQRQYAGKFKEGNEDEFGFKYFTKIGKPRVKNAAKNIDLDTKDVNIKADLPKDYYKAWIMRRDVRQWMKKRKLGQVFNSMVMMTPKYGSFVLKKVESEAIIMEVPLKNIKNDPSAHSIKDSWVIENHYYTPWELQNEGKERGWDMDKVAKAIKSFKTTGKENYIDDSAEEPKGSDQYILVKEFISQVPETLYDETGDEEKFVLCRFILVSAEGASTDPAKEGLLLDKKVLESHPYKDVHYDREEGRWLGVGIIEDLTDSQMMKNEQINLQMLGLRLANLILLQTQDETIARNIFTDVVNGDIVKAKAQLSRVDTRNYGTSDDNAISQEIESIANFLANTPEVTTGANLPSGTPLGLGAIMNQNANKLFDFIRENLGLFLEEVFEDWIIPDLEDDLNKAHILELVDMEELEWIAKRRKSNILLKKIGEFVMAKGRKPTVGEVAMAKEILEVRMEGKEQAYLDLKDDFYDFGKSVSADLTGESENKGVALQTIASIIQMVNGRLDMLENPGMKKLINKAGYSAVDFGSATTQPQETQQMGELANAVEGAPTPGV